MAQPFFFRGMKMMNHGSSLTMGNYQSFFYDSVWLRFVLYSIVQFKMGFFSEAQMEEGCDLELMT